MSESSLKKNRFRYEEDVVQKSAVEGALALDIEKIYHALLLDPNTASVCSPAEIRSMVSEMFEAEKMWLPQFK